MATNKYTMLDYAEDVLKVVPGPLTYQEIWEAGEEQGLTTKLGQTGKTPWQSLGSRLYVAIRDGSDKRFMRVGQDPARFWLAARKSELTPDDLKSAVAAKPAKPKSGFAFNERALHPLVAYFAFSNTGFNRGRNVYTKTIFHEKSKHIGLNEWTHPDLVGFYAPIEDWNSKLLALSQATDRSAIRLYSFEVKKQINRGNYREYFFQAVSNSSWANEGYLVACDIQQQDDLLSELERLSASFGIGIVQLDLEDIDSSHVLFPALHRDYLDWDTMNKLCEQNIDFETFVGDVLQDFTGRKIHDKEYDPIIDDPAAYIKKLRSAK